MSIVKIILPFPPSVNAKYNISRGRRVKSDDEKQWIKSATDAVNKQNIIPFIGRCYVAIELYYPDEYPRDAANYEKKVTDLLVSLKILKGDERRYIKGVFPYWNDEKGKYIIVKIIPVDEFSLSAVFD